MPEVTEAALARAHWNKNGVALEAFCEGPPSESLLHEILILEGEYNELQSWMMTPSKDGGGGA